MLKYKQLEVFMRKSKLLFRILKMTQTDKILVSFLIFFLCFSFIIFLFDPAIHSYHDALWYSFISVTTIGFGDIVATTLISRIATVLLAIYGIFVIALIPGVVVSYYTESLKLQYDESLLAFLDKLERLPQLSKDELTIMSQRAKELRKHKKRL